MCFSYSFKSHFDGLGSDLVGHPFDRHSCRCQSYQMQIVNCLSCWSLCLLARTTLADLVHLDLYLQFRESHLCCCYCGSLACQTTFLDNLSPPQHYDNRLDAVLYHLYSDLESRLNYAFLFRTLKMYKLRIKYVNY